jgi:hypothetical protein
MLLVEGARMSRLCRVLLAALLALAAALFAAGGSPALAASSPGCDAMNNPALDGFYYQATVTDQFYAGEVLSVTGSGPNDVAMLFEINSALIGAAVVDPPATITYTVPADGALTASWHARDIGFSGGLRQITWTISCSAVVVPPPAPVDSAEPLSAVFLSDVCEPDGSFAQGGHLTLDTDADDLGRPAPLLVAASQGGPWLRTAYASPPYILSYASAQALAALVGLSDYHDLWIKVGEQGSPVHLGNAIREREGRMDQLCGLLPAAP